MWLGALLPKVDEHESAKRARSAARTESELKPPAARGLGGCFIAGAATAGLIVAVRYLWGWLTQ